MITSKQIYSIFKRRIYWFIMIKLVFIPLIHFPLSLCKNNRLWIKAYLQFIENTTSMNHWTQRIERYTATCSLYHFDVKKIFVAEKYHFIAMFFCSERTCCPRNWWQLLSFKWCKKNDILYAWVVWLHHTLLVLSNSNIRPNI